MKKNIAQTETTSVLSSQQLEQVSGGAADHCTEGSSIQKGFCEVGYHAVETIEAAIEKVESWF